MCLFTIDATDKADADRAEYLAQHVEKMVAKQFVLFQRIVQKIFKIPLSKFHAHVSNLNNPEEIDRWLQAASTNMGEIMAVVHMTGKVPEISSLMELSRKEWDDLVDKFINKTATVVQRSLEHFVPGGAKDPRLYKDKTGIIMTVGPDLPVGRKVSGAQRARVEVFRGALRPFTTTVNQELSDVLKSKVRSFTVFPGGVDGREPDNEKNCSSIELFCIR